MVYNQGQEMKGMGTMIKQYTDDYRALFETDYEIDNVDEILVKDGNFFIGIADDNENMLVIEYSTDDYLVCTEMTLDELLHELQDNGFYDDKPVHELEDDYREFYTSC